MPRYLTRAANPANSDSVIGHLQDMHFLGLPTNQSDMARQESIIRLTGSLGGLSFYFDKRTGYQIRTKGGFHGKPVKTAPQYERTRENSAEFGTASRSARLLRTALHSLHRYTADNRFINRLNAQMLRVLKSDPLNIRGKRTVSHGECTLLKGFEFNKQASFTDMVGNDVTPVWDKKSNQVTITITNTFIKHPSGATHFRIGSRVAALNFMSLKAKVFEPDTPAEMLPVITPPATIASHIHHIEHEGATHLIVALNIEFFQLTNEVVLPLRDSKYNAGVITEVYSLI